MVMFADLGGAARQTIRWMQYVNYGRIEATVRNGRIVADPAPRLFRSMRIGKEESARRELMLENFALKASQEEVLAHIARIKNGVIVIDIQHGLAVRVTVIEEAEDVIIAVDAVVVDGDGGGDAMITCVSAPEDDGDDEDGACDVEGGITDRVDGDGGDGGDPVDDGDGASDANGGASDDETNPITDRMEKLIRYYASRMVGVAGIREDDLEDVEQDLRLHLYVALMQYDSDRASPETYAARVIERKASNMIRDLSRRRARIRDEASIEALDDATEDIPALCYTENLGLNMDISDGMEELSDWDREVAERLPHGTISEVADTLGVHRERICTAQKRIRSALRRKGLDTYI